VPEFILEELFYPNSYHIKFGNKAHVILKHSIKIPFFRLQTQVSNVVYKIPYFITIVYKIILHLRFTKMLNKCNLLNLNYIQGACLVSSVS
jgi:hypothetical protein